MKIKITDEENENPVLHEQCDFRRELMKSLILARIEFQQKQFGKKIVFWCKFYSPKILPV